MADNNNPADLLNNLAEGNNNNENTTSTDENLQNITKLLEQIAKNIGTSAPNTSQSNAHMNRRNSSISSLPGAVRNPLRGSDSMLSPYHRRSSGNLLDDMLDGFMGELRDQLEDGVRDSDWGQQLHDALGNFADALGGSIQDIPQNLGRQLTRTGIDAIKNSNWGRQAITRLSDALGQDANQLTNILNRGTQFFGGSSGAGGADIQSRINSLLSNGADTAMPAASSTEAGSAIIEGQVANEGVMLAETAAPIAETAPVVAETTPVVAETGLAAGGGALLANPYVLVAIVGIIALLEMVGPEIEGLIELTKSYISVGDRFEKSIEKMLEGGLERWKQDLETYVTYPFKILEQAAQSAYDTWDNVLKTINATQGYTKSDLQDLMSVYAQRLRDEGLSSYVSATDITSNLKNVLESGLSGQVAEEFAYLATKLNAAVPTEDFFQYASTYSSLAANAIQAGKAEEEAIAYANSQLEQFASNVLYASRQIAGGFSTGLKDAQTLLESSVKIANAAKTGSASEISGVLTSVSAIVGAVAPDLAGSLVDNIVQAAVGGNSDAIVALRSLANMNASNTSFLRAMAEDPKSVFTALFSHLGELQNMSNDNFMEVAEGLADVFGVSMDAFARVDFQYLAKAISKMDTNSAALSENMELLATGQTTTTAEQLKMQQINKYILDEGLSYVLDNEAAREIQRHMWQEQQTQAITEANYGIEIVGGTLELIKGIAETGKNLLKFLMGPIGVVADAAFKIVEMRKTEYDAAAQQADIAQMLMLGNVGKQDNQRLGQLMAKGVPYEAVESLVDMMGGHSVYTQGSGTFQLLKSGSLFGPLGMMASSVIQGVVNNLSKDPAQGLPSSKYDWGTISKSTANALASRSFTSDYEFDTISASAQITNKSNANIERYIKSINKYVEDNKTFEEWMASANRYGISDFQAAIEEYGVTEGELRSAFESKQAQVAGEHQHERQVNEDAFWAAATTFYNEDFPDFESDLFDMEQQLIDLSDQQLAQLKQSNAKLTEFYDQWIDYYVNHTAYSRETLNAYDVAAIRNAEKAETGDAVLALADALTSNAVDLKDPAVQTNVLLADLLKVCVAIMQQNNEAKAISLPTALSALGLGLTNS